MVISARLVEMHMYTIGVRFMCLRSAAISWWCLNWYQAKSGNLSRWLNSGHHINGEFLCIRIAQELYWCISKKHQGRLSFGTTPTVYQGQSEYSKAFHEGGLNLRRDLLLAESFICKDVKVSTPVPNHPCWWYYMDYIVTTQLSILESLTRIFVWVSHGVSFLL